MRIVLTTFGSLGDLHPYLALGCGLAQRGHTVTVATSAGYRENVERVTAEDVQRAAEKYIRPGEIAIVLVGDAEQVLPQAQSYAGIVDIFDTEGQPQEITKYAVDSNAEPVDVAGKWSLLIDFQGQEMPVSLSIDKNDNAVTGVLETMLGEGKIDNVSVRGNRFSAVATAEFQGQPLELTINGSVEGEIMSGTITAPISPEPLTFTGSR